MARKTKKEKAGKKASKKTAKMGSARAKAKTASKPAKKAAGKAARSPAAKMQKRASKKILKKPASKMKRMPAKKPAAKIAKPVVKMGTGGLPAANKISAPAPVSRKPRCMVLAGFGLNAELELAHAFGMAGAEAEVVHFSDISSGKRELSDYQIFAIPGGWSFGDDIAGGRVLSNKLKSTFRQQFEEFASSGKPILGVCNGFQTLVKLGALPNVSGSFAQESTLTFNKSGRFEDRWVHLKPHKSACKYFEGVEFIHCPVRHGEGQFVPRDSALLSQLQRQGMVALRYADPRLRDSPGYPANPNGSPFGIAGICDRTGKILGIMPHPECSVYKTQFPRFTSGISFEKNSLRFFENIVKEGAKHL